MAVGSSSPPIMKFNNIGCEFVAVILAATSGARLFPLTSISPGSNYPTSPSSLSSSPAQGGGEATGSVSSPTVPYKHLLPLGGVPILLRLIHSVYAAGFCECVLVLAAEDTATLPSLLAQDAHLQRVDPTGDHIINVVKEAASSHPVYLYHRSPSLSPPQQQQRQSRRSRSSSSPLRITIVRLPPDDVAAAATSTADAAGPAESVTGSVPALRHVESTFLQHQPHFRRSHVVVLPGDLCLLRSQNDSTSGSMHASDATTADPLQRLVEAHRMGQQQEQREGQNSILSSYSTGASTACTMLLTNVLEVDEHGLPLKESAKQKRGGLARDEEEIEYMALVYTTTSATNDQPPPRVVWKQPKIDVEEDRDMLGTSPKLLLNKGRLQASRNGHACVATRVGIHWNDVHVYTLSPWVRKLILLRPKLVSLQSDLLPLLITRQFQGGILETFGSSLASNAEKENSPEIKDILDSIVGDKEYNDAGGSVVDGTTNEEPSGHNERGDRGTNLPAALYSHVFSNEYEVCAVVIQEANSVLRAHTIPSYLHANKEFANAVCQLPNEVTTQGMTALDMIVPTATQVNRKFSSLLLPGTQTGQKVTFKSAVVGRNCKLGNKSRLNNVVLMDHVTIGDNVVLQNSIIGAGCSIGDNSNLNDCQVCKDLPAGTKEKSESFLATAEP